MASKSQYRERFLTRRNGLSPAQRTRSSQRITAQILDQPAWQKAALILTYVATGSEVETRPLIQAAWQAGKRVAVPLIHPERDETLLSELNQLSDLEPGPKHRIPEPTARGRHLVDPSTVDLAILPGIAFDEYGGRIGFGSGYFDRLLPSLTKAALWGVAFGVQLSEQALPMQPHDHPVHAIVTEDEFIYPEDIG